MRVIAIGATGFIGRHVVDQLAAAGHEVAVVHRGGTPLCARPGVTEILGERSSLLDLRPAFRAWSPDVAIDMILSSAGQARQTLEALRGVAGRVVAISSGDVYRAMAVVHRLEGSPLEPVPLTEESALRSQPHPYTREALAAARSAYPWIDDDYDKVRVEQAIASDLGLRATILRLPMVYGPGDPLHRLHPLLKRMADGRPAILLGRSQARCVSCLGYVENVAAAIALAAVSLRAAGRIYNVADPDPFTEAEWASKIGALAGWQGRILALPPEKLPPHLQLSYNFEQHLFMDSTRIRTELDYAEPVPLDEALRRTIEWEQSNPPRQIDAARFDYAAEDAAIACQDT